MRCLEDDTSESVVDVDAEGKRDKRAPNEGRTSENDDDDEPKPQRLKKA